MSDIPASSDRDALADPRHALMCQLWNFIPSQAEIDLLAVANGILSNGELLDALAALRGWSPPARMIETAEQLDSLPVNSIVTVSDGRVWQRQHGDGQCWFEPGWTGGYTSADAMWRAGSVGETVRVLWEPKAGDR